MYKTANFSGNSNENLNQMIVNSFKLNFINDKSFSSNEQGEKNKVKILTNSATIYRSIKLVVQIDWKNMATFK